MLNRWSEREGSIPHWPHQQRGSTGEQTSGAGITLWFHSFARCVHVLKNNAQAH